MDKPENVTQSGDGFFYTRIDNRMVRVCEDCWEPIPNYVDFPHGLTSPESDGDAGGNFAKKRTASVEGKNAVEPMRKAVCLDCYFYAFMRVYPDAALPELSGLQRTESIAPPPEPEVEAVFVGEPKP